MALAAKTSFLQKSLGVSAVRQTIVKFPSPKFLKSGTPDKISVKATVEELSVSQPVGC